MYPPIYSVPFRSRPKRVRIIVPEPETSPCSSGQNGQFATTYNNGCFRNGDLEGGIIKASEFWNVNASNCIILNSNIIGSRLRSCTLVNCVLNKSNVENSKVSGCKIFNSSSTYKSFIRNSQAWKCQFINCTIEQSETHRSTIQGGTAIYCKLIQTTKVTDALSEASKFLNCDVKDSNLSNCHLHQTKFTAGTLVYSLVTKSPLAFRKFPAEVRAMIFSNGVSLELLVALKADPELYWEAVGFLDTGLPLVISKQNREFTKAILRALLEKVKKVSIRQVVLKYDSSLLLSPS
jgi:uncharacterized protein YjbI with pentapeptide repeats